MAYLCGLFGRHPCQALRSWFGRHFKKAKAEPEPAQLEIGEPYDVVHQVHITDADVGVALASGDEEIINMEYLQKCAAGAKATEDKSDVGMMESQVGQTSSDSRGD